MVTHAVAGQAGFPLFKRFRHAVSGSSIRERAAHIFGMVPPGESSENTPSSPEAPSSRPGGDTPVPSTPRESRLGLFIGGGLLLIAIVGAAVWIGLRSYEEEMHQRRITAERTMQEILKKEGEHPTTAPIHPVKKPDTAPAPASPDTNKAPEPAAPH